MKHLNPLKPLHCGPDEPEMSFKLRLRVEYKIELHTRAWVSEAGPHASAQIRGMKTKIT